MADKNENPNLLGRAFSYLNDAWEYASTKSKTGRVLGIGNGFGRNNEHLLQAQSQSGPGGNLVSIAQTPGSFDEALTIMSNRGHYNTVRNPELINTREALKLATMSAWVYSDLKLISSRVSTEAAWPVVKKVVKGKRRDEYENLNDHPIEELLLAPNNLMTGSYLVEYLTVWYLLLGNGYYFISTPAPGVGKPQELWPLPANQVTPLPNSLREGMGVFRGKPVVDFAYTIDQHSPPIKLPGENVLHRRTVNPFDWWQGFSPLNAALLAIEQDRAQEKYVRDFFGRDNAVPTAIISLPKEMRPLDFNRAREQLYEQFSDGRKSLITRAGDIDVEVIKQTINEMQITQARDFSRKEIDTVFGVPDGLINGGGSNDGRLAAEITFARNVIQPLIDGLARDLTNNLCPYYGPDVIMVAPNVIPQDQALEVQKFTQYRTVRTVNENRKELGLGPLKLPDDLFDQLDGVDLMNDVPVLLLPNLVSMQLQEDAAEDAQEQMSITGVEGSGSYQQNDNSATSLNNQIDRTKGQGSLRGPKKPRAKRNSHSGNSDPAPAGMQGSDKPAAMSAREAVKSQPVISEAVKAQPDVKSDDDIIESNTVIDNESDDLIHNIANTALAADLNRLRRVCRKALRDGLVVEDKIKAFETDAFDTSIALDIFNSLGIDGLQLEQFN